MENGENKVTKLVRAVILVAFLSVQLLRTQAAPVDVDGDGMVGPQEAIDLSQNWKGPALPLGGPQPWQINGATIFYNAGKVGIGSASPRHQLRISGGPLWTSNGWTGSLELDNAAAIGWRSNAGGQRFGIGQSGGGLYIFHTASDPGTATSEAKYALTITDAGAVGIGTPAPDTRFQVNDGRIRLRESATLERWDLFYDPPSEKFYLQENAAFNHLVFTKGPDPRVGIGTDTPSVGTKLNVLTNAVGSYAIKGDGPNGSGVVGTSAAAGNAATAGLHSGGNGIGLYGAADTGVSANGVYGKSDQGSGVYGLSVIGIGAKGVSTSNAGVEGTSSSNVGVSGVSTSSTGVAGKSNSGQGVSGFSVGGTGVYGQSNGGAGTGVWGVGSSSSTGVRAQAQTAIWAESTARNGTGIFAVGFEGGEAGYFVGQVQIHGELYVVGPFTHIDIKSQIDHPLDPAGRFGRHDVIDFRERTQDQCVGSNRRRGLIAHDMGIGKASQKVEVDRSLDIRFHFLGERR